MKTKLNRAARFCAIVVVLILSLTPMQAGLAEPVTTSISFMWVSLDGDAVHGYGWPNNVNVTLTIDDPSTSMEVDYTATGLTTYFALTPIGPNTQVNFSLSNIIDIKPGFTITISDGNVTRTLVIPNLSILSIDTKARTISGTATPGAGVTAFCMVKGCYAPPESTTADSEGNWITPIPYHFVHPLQFSGYVREEDADGDWATVSVSITIPPEVIYLPILLR